MSGRPTNRIKLDIEDKTVNNTLSNFLPVDPEYFGPDVV